MMGYLKFCGTLLLLAVASLFFACSNDDHVAGILIETNTGNKVLIETNTGNKTARVMISVDELNLAEGDTLQLIRTERDTVGDTIQVTCYYTEGVVRAADMASGFVSMNQVPAGNYDSLVVVPLDGEVRSIAVGLNAEEGKTYRIDDAGMVSLKETGIARIALPKGFEDLAEVDESFENMPFVISLDSKIQNPCLVDAAGNMILLDISAGSDFGNSAGDSSEKKYWGQMPEVIFSDAGSVQFEVLEKCQETDSLGLLLGRHVEHFDHQVPSDSAVAALPQMESLHGGALWTTETDQWYYINDFKPFVDDYNMTVSFWINADAEKQPATSIRLLSAKKDSVGFIVQQRTDRTGINLRIDAGSDGYSQTFGKAEILDGKWHNYSFRINKDSVVVFVDGELIQEAAVVTGAGFSTAYNPAVGGDKYNLVGGLDEIFFFDGSQSNNWMRLFYALQQK